MKSDVIKSVLLQANPWTSQPINELDSSFIIVTADWYLVTDGSKLLAATELITKECMFSDQMPLLKMDDKKFTIS